MIEQLVTRNLQLPYEIDESIRIIKKDDLEYYQSVQRTIDQYSEAKYAEINSQHELATEELSLQKVNVMEQISGQVQEFNTLKKDALGKIAEFGMNIIPEILQRYHVHIKNKSKLKYAIDQILDKYGKESGVVFQVKSYEAFKAVKVNIPKGWKVEENKELDCECKLVLKNAEVVCNFDALYFGMLKEMSGFSPMETMEV